MDDIQDKKIITLADLRAMRDQIIDLAEKNGATNVRVFGSVARGDITENSDVDLLVDVREGTSIFDMVGLWQDLRDLLGCEVSLIGDSHRDTRFRRRIEKDLVPL